jgi:adenylate cyclase
MKNKLLNKILICLLAAAVITGLAWTGWLTSPDNTVSDALYQRPKVTDGEIVVIGIDQRAIETFGPMPWNRSIFADAIGYLDADPETAPAAIGLDVLFVGASADPDADDYLAEMAALGENVVVAVAAQFGTGITETDAGFSLDSVVRGWDAPYEDLAAVTRQGQINAMAESGGAIRHARLAIDAPGVGRVKSFARVLYEMYCDYRGEEPNPEPETNRDGAYYLSFTAKPGAYYTGVSVLDLIEGTVDPEEFAGKIVLIGPYATGMQDDYPTAIDRTNTMYGVEIQANAIDNFRANFYPKEAPAWIPLAVLFAVSFALVLLLWDRRVGAAVAIWLGACSVWIGIARILYGAGVVLPVLYVPLAATILFIASVAMNYIRAAREKRFVQNTFGHYVDPAVMKQLLDGGAETLELGGKLYDIAVLFVDIRGFTTMSEALDPPTVVEIINKYLTLTTECIMKNHGTLDKFVGDCTMAFWNAPFPQEDAIWLACRAAMDMVEGSKALGEELQQRFGRSVTFGVGVNFGPAVVGNIGAPQRMDYTAIGDTVNTAARLEANAPGGKILISRVVADALGSRAEVTSLGDTIKLKGKAEGFEILTLDALHE